MGIHTEETRIERDICTPMSTAALFIIAGTWKQLRCPSAHEWIRKLWYIYTMEYYSAIKKNTFKLVLMRWMKLEPIIQSEVSQKGKHQYSILIQTGIKTIPMEKKCKKVKWLSEEALQIAVKRREARSKTTEVT